MSQTEQHPVLAAIHRRRSVRSYLPQTVDRATLERILDAAVQAPTAMHGEPWAFAVVQDRDLLQRLSERAKALLLDHAAEAGTPAAPGSEIHAMMSDPGFNIFYDVGTLVVICRSTASPYADADCWLAAENLMLAAVAEGLGTCCIGLALGALELDESRRELGIPDAGAAVAAIIVGVPREVPPSSPRKPPQILCWKE